ncbi:MAG: hypothetical protein JWM42_3966 [Burkholderia sp.]|nr:hypothetical protein [Burkholderia sp.]
MGGSRTYDYRYVWLRDAGMIASALLRAGSDGDNARKFLDFLCGSAQGSQGKPLLPPFLALNYKPAEAERHLDLAGYRNSRPVRIGNNANTQVQFDGYANVLLAAKQIYGKFGMREHWATVRCIADFLAGHWHERDHGIWEEQQRRQYTVGKVITACALRYIAAYADNREQRRHWENTARKIEDYVPRRCINSEGAYAAVAGGEAVDVSAALYPAWGYVSADTPEMVATMRVLERAYSHANLHWRHLEDSDSRDEGAFLAGTIWVAQYRVARQDLSRARSILEAALEYANDLGLFAEEADPATGGMLGNFPQTLLHAALIGAVVDYKYASRT